MNKTQIKELCKTWGTEPWERKLAFPCDPYAGSFSDAYYRGITIRAEPEIIFLKNLSESSPAGKG